MLFDALLLSQTHVRACLSLDFVIPYVGLVFRAHESSIPCMLCRMMLSIFWWLRYESWNKDDLVKHLLPHVNEAPDLEVYTRHKHSTNMHAVNLCDHADQNATLHEPLEPTLNI